MSEIIATCIVIVLCTIAITLAGVLIVLCCIYSVLLRIKERQR